MNAEQRAALARKQRPSPWVLASIALVAGAAALLAMRLSAPAPGGLVDHMASGQFVQHFVSLHQLPAAQAGAARCHGAIDAPDARVWVFGDLDGRSHLMLGALMAVGLVALTPGGDDVRWTGGRHDWIVQCGDQLDRARVGGVGGPKTSRAQYDSLDLGVLLLMERLREVSGGRVLSLIGNHEWMNVFSDFSFVSGDNARCVPLAQRKALLRYDGLLGRILRRRHFLLQINDAVFAHAGVHGAALQGVARQRGGALIDTVNALVDDPRNYNSDTTTPMFNNVLMDDAHGLLWSREYMMPELVQRPDPPRAVDAGVLDRLPGTRLNIMGHNKHPTMFVLRDSAAGSDVVEAAAGAVLRLEPTDTGALMTDAAPVDEDRLPYVVLHAAGSSFRRLEFKEFVASSSPVMRGGGAGKRSVVSTAVPFDVMGVLRAVSG